VLQEDEIYDESDRHDDEHNADREDDLSDGLSDNLSDSLGDDLTDGLGNNLSDRLGNNLSEPEPITQSEIAAMQMMMEEQRENQLHTVDRDEFKYWQLHWAYIVEVYTISVPLNASVNSRRKSREIKIWYTTQQSYLPRSETNS